MMTQAKRNNALLGTFWISLGLLLIMYASVITVQNFHQAARPVNGSTSVLSEYKESTSNVLVSRESSPRVILEPQLTIDQTKMSFKLDDSYVVAYEMFRSKTIVSDNAKNTRQQFQEFLGLYGITIDPNGMLVDVRGSIVDNKLIECHIMGYFPDKPYIKSNCV